MVKDVDEMFEKKKKPSTNVKDVEQIFIVKRKKKVKKLKKKKVKKIPKKTKFIEPLPEIKPDK